MLKGQTQEDIIPIKMWNDRNDSCVSRLDFFRVP